MLSLIVSFLILGSSVHGAAVPNPQARQSQALFDLLNGIIEREIEPFLMNNQTVLNTMVDGLKGAYFHARSLSEQGSSLSSENKELLAKIKKIVSDKTEDLQTTETYTKKDDQDDIENNLDKPLIKQWNAIVNYVENRNEETKKELREGFLENNSPIRVTDYIVMNSPGFLSRNYARPPIRTPVDARKITANETTFLALVHSFREQYFSAYLNHIIHSAITNPKFGDEMQNVIDRFTARANHLERILKEESKDFYKEVLRSFRNVVLQVRKLNAANPAIDMETEIFNRLAKICPVREFAVLGYDDVSSDDKVAIVPYDENRVATVTEGRKYSMIFSSDNYKENGKKYRQLSPNARIEKFKSGYVDKNLKTSLEEYRKKLDGNDQILFALKPADSEFGRVHSDDESLDGFIFRPDESSPCLDFHTCQALNDENEKNTYVYVFH